MNMLAVDCYGPAKPPWGCSDHTLESSLEYWQPDWPPLVHPLLRCPPLLKYCSPTLWLAPHWLQDKDKGTP